MHPTRVPKPQSREVGWSKAVELVKVARRDGGSFDCATWLHRAKERTRSANIRDFNLAAF